MPWQSYALNTDLVKRLKKEPSPTPSPSPASQQSTPSSDETASWKTYTNYKYKISIMYPADYLITENLGYDVYFSSSKSEKKDLEECHNDPDAMECNLYSLGLSFDIKSKPKNQSLEDFVEKVRGPSIPFSSTMVDGYPAVQNQFEGIGLVHHVYIDRDDRVFHIFANTIVNAEKNMEIYNKMLSTFKFLE